MLRLHFVLLASIACLVASQEAPEAEGTTVEPSPASDTPSSSDINPFLDINTAGTQVDTSTVSAESENTTSTDEMSTTESHGNVTTPEPSSATTLGVWSATSLVLLVVAVMS